MLLNIKKICIKYVLKGTRRNIKLLYNKTTEELFIKPAFSIICEKRA